MCFSEEDRDDVIKRYTKRYKEFGYSPKSLGWDKGKQNIRFDILTSQYNFKNKHVLDIGCGFGDLNKVLMAKASKYKYTGIDLVESFLIEAERRYKSDNVQFINANIIDYIPSSTFDYAISSGVFNFELVNKDNYKFIEEVIKSALEMVKDGLAFDFLSDRVDYKLEYTFHCNPEKILSIAYKYSRNVILRNDYMPFEFSLFILKDDSFNKEDTIFNLYKTSQ